MEKLLKEKTEATIKRIAETVDIPVLTVPDNVTCFEEPQCIPNMPAALYEAFTDETPEPETVPAVIVPVKYFEEWKSLSEKDIETVIRHEYGHYLTLGKITDYHRKEYRFKTLVMDLILTAFLDLNDNTRYYAEKLYFHHRLPVEDMATKAAGLSLSDIEKTIHSQYGLHVHNDIPYTDVNEMLTKTVTADMYGALPESSGFAVIKFADRIIESTAMGMFTETVYAFQRSLTGNSINAQL